MVTKATDEADIHRSLAYIHDICSLSLVVELSIPTTAVSGSGGGTGGGKPRFYIRFCTIIDK
jgi:hypothetical protein